MTRTNEESAGWQKLAVPAPFEEGASMKVSRTAMLTFAVLTVVGLAVDMVGS
ncbi:hypothetical protein ACFU8W_14465 [Streptomyces sp. NPDC057565]|uniref:hypothetical protein n=1 Tax=Streptomyces sp. NPDC057565 TaxID=3346169 RepID=UPI003692F3C9